MALFPLGGSSPIGRQRGALADELAKALPEAVPKGAALTRGDRFATSADLWCRSAPPIADNRSTLGKQLSVGAEGMNLLIATMLGLVGGWLTGWAAYSERVRAAFCGPGERIAGFLFLGSPGVELEERSRPSLADVIQPWNPPAA